MQLTLSQIRIDGGTQPRIRIDENVVAEYANAMREGATFPPVVAFFDGIEYWLADGFHRLHAARKNDLESILSEVRTGTKRDAILYSVSANASHGLRRTNEDKRRAVQTLLGDPEWAQWSDREIARRCGVHHEMVSHLRPRPSLADSASEKVYTTKHGTVSKMNTEKIGKKETFVDSSGRHQTVREGEATAETRRAQIAELAEQGHRAEQIAEILGLKTVYVRGLANRFEIQLTDKTIGKRLSINYRRVLEETVLGLEASAASLKTVGVSLEGIEKDEARDWAQSIQESIRIFSSLRKKLLEHSNG